MISNLVSSFSWFILGYSDYWVVEFRWYHLPPMARFFIHLGRLCPWVY